MASADDSPPLLLTPEGARQRAFVALGSNLGDPQAALEDAMDRLGRVSDGPLVRSSLWRSAPVDCPPGSPWFVNAVAALFPRLGETPETLLELLLAMEREWGPRSRRIRNAPRRLDLDLIAFREETRATATLTLPHPRACVRRFVLEPLAEIAPDWVLPGQRATVRRLLAGLPAGPGCERLPPRAIRRQ
ncbi:MAG TPA: 2-amino-4-hydroxy-6-hydroxymethyldihydropteridine diphosphokinase [Verrucomicrobiota bacterium]|nr:2-amino-4-hydroxy-6-hydroxymethyldihydropteridine diphosphokinase [Verrucomicrobiota bacterium]HNU53387.1 2-amino-4-hydroxy-6-hydroxymethyldihydropteridine diphosphokinase [Verrucomicrobiota bacterium]